MVTVAGGVLCAAGGLIVMVAWFARLTAVLRVGGPSPPVFNAALAVAVTGAALVAFVRGRLWVTLLAGLVDVAVGGATLAEWALGRGPEIDQLFARAYITGPHEIPGRPGIDFAICLTLIGAGLLLWGPWRLRRRPAVLAAAVSVVTAVAITAITGCATGTPTPYVYPDVTAMALPSATALFILATSLLSAAWRDSRLRHPQCLPGWLPMPSAAVVFGVASGVWLATISVSGNAGRYAVGMPTEASAAIGVLSASVVMLVVWLAQQADGRRRIAMAAAEQSQAAENLARRNEDQLFRFLDAMPVGLFVLTPDGKPYYGNSEAERLLGRRVVMGTSADDLAETYQGFVIGTDKLYPTDELPVVRALAGQSSHIRDMEIRKPDGGITPIEGWGRPVRMTDGAVEFGLAAFIDISDRLEAEQTVADQAALLELAHDAIFVRDINGRITYWNAGAEHMYGVSRVGALGCIAHELLQTEFPESLSSIEGSVAEKGQWEGELIHRCADGRHLVVESRWAGQFAHDGSLTKILEVNRDVTARKDVERERLQTAEEIQGLNASLERQVRHRTVHLEQANKNLAAFSYSVAHDLRAPLRALSGYAEALAEDYGGLLDTTGIGYTKRIQCASEQMAILIDHLLQLSRLAQAKMNLVDVDLSLAVTAICDRLRASNPGRRVRMTVQDGVKARADRTMILTMLENLLENAWKFTVHRDLAAIEFGTATTDRGECCCFVRDNGVGFDPAYADKLFRPFQRLHGAKEFSGTGAGLATVQRIIDRHGGRTWAEGAVNNGATFYFVLEGLSATRPTGATRL
jgi:PAS domain S-box-containing protein